MAATWSQAAKVRRAFKAGRTLRKDRILPPTTAIHEACILQDRLRAAMAEANLPSEDVRVAVVLLVPNYVPERDAVHVLRVPEPSDLPAIFRRVQELEDDGRVQALGLGVWQRDRDSDSHTGWVQAFLTGDRAARAIAKACRVLVEKQGGESAVG
jgi:hypothetical protein